MTVGEKILNLRKARGWSQEELAERVGVTRQAVSRWESGSAKPDADKIIAICDLFGVTADYLLRDMNNGMTAQQENELLPVTKKVPFRRLSGMILILVCAAVLLAIWLMSVMYPVTPWHEQQLMYFLYSYKLTYIWYGLWVGLFVGVWRVFSPKTLKEFGVWNWVRKAARKIWSLITGNR